MTIDASVNVQPTGAEPVVGSTMLVISTSASPPSMIVSASSTKPALVFGKATVIVISPRTMGVTAGGVVCATDQLSARYVSVTAPVAAYFPTSQ